MVAVVTGATGGIGRAVCERLAAGGHDLVLTWRSDQQRAEQLAAGLRSHGAEVRLVRCDLEVEDQVRTLAEAVGDRLEVLVHAAGPHVPMIHLSRVSGEQLRRQLLGDAMSFFTLTQALLPALRRAGGSVVLVSTAATDRYPVRDGLSAVPKGSAEQLARAYAAEEGRYGVRVNIVGPGMLTEGMAERLISSGELDERALAITRNNIPLRRFGRADDVAAAVDFLAGPDAGFISGQKINVDGGYTV
ncbi:dehydrogenase [Enemella dayhoffiae]|uniref:Dehydrogenase n=1 Tax=Enemella dayhoffiae TaxID=2016507 RepID=A0A255GQB0_9ACTN|nr:SDR family oxidoreductase [Enemella dayhoffiae]OYO16573.1 dehydrogenase [Enemella dayhoffiae]